MMKLSSWLRRALAVLSAILITALLAGCSGAGSSSGDFPAVEPAPAQDGGIAMPEQGGEKDESGDGDRMIIRSKTMRIEVTSTVDAVTGIQDLARTYEGTVVNMQVSTDSDEWLYHYDENGNLLGDGTALRGWVTVRVPTDAYEDFVADVAKIGVVKAQSEATDDVTQEHVDLSARLENMRAQEVRLREFFESAKNVTEMLAIETELGRVRGEIESLDAQVTWLERQASMATVSVELTEPGAVVSPGGESWGFVDAITSGIRGAAQLLTLALTVVIASSPLWLTALILLFPVRAWIRRRRAKAAPATGVATPAAEPDAAAPDAGVSD